jgi:outer membrane receptor for ferrienterochelin and colicin
MFAPRIPLRRILPLLFAVGLFMPAAFLYAQVTNGTLTGVVVTADGTPLPGVTVEAVHTPTGTRYSAVTGANGRFTIPNARVGGPYTVAATLEGFKPYTARSVEVRLGEAAEVPVTLQMAAVAEAITVTAVADPVINPNRTGSTSAVSEQQIETLPTVNRQIQDFARTNPYVNTSLTGEGTFMFIAGRNNRYNTIQIDGAVNNDLFGLSSSGTPGGGSGTQPISLDSIQQIQVAVSPYDVRQSGFTGGGVNVVTRSGTNNLDGSVFGTKRDPSFVGEGPFNTSVREFDSTQYGGRIGGPIMRDRLFYFVSGESNKRNDPDDTSADPNAGTGTTYNNVNPNAADVASFLKSKYNFDPGSLGDLVFKTKNDLLFGRLDANLGSSNNLTLRHNYVNGTNDNTPSSYTRTTTRFYFPTNIYRFPSKTNSTVAQLNSVFNANSYNEGRVNFTTVREHRETPVIFPTIELGPGGERSGTLQTGIERFSGANALNQDILELTDDFTFIRGAHSVIVGTHNEFFKFSNLFIQDFYGYYHFANFAALQAGTPDIYRIGYATGDNPKRPTEFKAGQYSLYANDQWRLQHGLTLTFGLRADKPAFNTKPSFNPIVQTGIGYSTSAVPSESITLEPRVGFNWDITGAGRQQLRGGIGVFQGRTPFVWISNNYGNTGIEQVLKGCTTAACMPTFNPDPNNQPRLENVAGAVQDVALADPDFKFPRVLRSTLGYDRELFYGIRATVEALWSKTMEDVYYYNVNKRATGTSALDGRPTYSSISTQLGNAYLLSNTEKGSDLTESLQLNKTIGNLSLSASYAHQKARSVGDPTSSTASSQWQFGFLTTGDIYTQVLSTSTFQVEHRMNTAVTYNFATGPFTHAIGAFYVAQSGQPYTLLMGGDANRDSSPNNDLLYLPGPGNMILCPSNATAPTATAPCGSGRTPIDIANLTNFLSSVGIDPNTTGNLERNSLRQPWTRRLDLHYGLGLPQFMGARVLIEADILNLLNLFDNESGVQRFVSNNTYMPVTYQGQDPTSGKPVYREAAAGRLKPGNQFSTANTASRWQGRLGLRINF